MLAAFDQDRDLLTELVHRATPKPVVTRAASPLSTYHDRPAAFARDLVRWRHGQAPTGYQLEVLERLADRKRVSVRGPHGLGKTADASLAVLWFALTREDAGEDWKIPTTASAWRQLTKYLWPEIHKWARLIDWELIGRPPLDERYELLTLSIKLRHGEAFAVASNDPATLEGAHADQLLYVFDEAKAIPVDTFDAAEGAFSGAGGDTHAEAYAFAISTPGEPNGRFHEIQTRRPGTEDWWARHVTLDEVIAAGRVSQEWANQRARQWGRQSAVYQNRVLGEFASSDEDGVIPLAWVEHAIERWTAWDESGRPYLEDLTALGVDVARGGADQTVFAERYGDLVLELRRYPHDADTTVTAGRAAGVLRAADGGRAVVDVIGVGAGVFDQLRAWDTGTFGPRPVELDVVGFVASEGTDRVDRSGELGFVNVRAAGWWNLRELLDPAYSPTIALPPDDELIGDLTAPRWRVMSGGRIQIESKDDMRKRLGRSTDAGDAVVQAFWTAPSPAPVKRGGLRHTA